MAKFKKKVDYETFFPEYPLRCEFCTKAIDNQDQYIKHLEFHVRDYALKLQLIL